MSIDEALLQSDRLARAEALDIRRSFIVQAPAGSGKTELLIQRYLRLLACVEQPEEVVAITFTRKAAQEMQSRALAAMRDASCGATVQESHHAVTLEAARQVLDRDREKGWELLESPRRMRIQTLDAFNAAIARSLPFSSGLGSAGRITTDEEMQALYRSAASATLDWFLSEGETSDALERILSHLDNNTGLYIDYMSSMLATRDQWIPITGTGLLGAGAERAVRRRLEQNVAEQVSARLERVRCLLPQAHLPLLMQLARYAADNSAAENDLHILAACDELPSAEAHDLDAWRALCGLLLTKSGSFRKSVNKNDGFPTGDAGEKQQLLSLLQDLSSDRGLCAELQRVRELPDARYSNSQWAVLLALFRLLPVAVGELRRLFIERGVTDHTEVAMAAAAALGSVDDPGEKSLLLDFAIKHLLIDEMQDTSIAQYQLIEQLVAGWERGDGRTLFCVGDPMQSIYRFRNAEVGQFLLARKNGIGQIRLEPLVLRQNFRSGEHLVHWFNTVFAQILPAKDDVTAGAIAYSASVPVSSDREPGACHIHPLFNVSHEEEAEYTVEVIRSCLDAALEKSTVVLVRSRTQLPLLLVRLRRAGIDYQAVEIDRLTDLPEIIDVLALTRALSHGGDRTAWLGLLRSPMAGLSWTDLHALVFNEPQRTVWELLQDGKRLLALSAEAREIVHNFRERMAPFITGNGTRSLRQAVEEAWYALSGPLLLRNSEETDNVYRYFDLLEGLDVAGTLYDVAELESRLDQERVSGRDSADCPLHVMTMHKAKGLQFDHVVIYGLGRASRTDQKSIMSWLNLPDVDGSTSMIISPVGARAEGGNDPLHNFVEATERAKSRLEQDRLLYVACTRARETVHLIGHVTISARGKGFDEPRDGTLLQRLWPTIRPLFEEAFATAAPAALEAGAPTAARPLVSPLLRRLRRNPDHEPPPAPVRCSVAPLAESEGEQQVSFNWVGTVARHAGTIVHRWLHRISAGSLRVEVANLTLLRPLCRNMALELGAPQRDVDAVCDRALEALRGILEDPRGRWILFGPGSTEMPLSGLWNGRTESIVIDRVRIDADGTHWVVDYKTSSHEGSGLEGFLLREGQRYEPQLLKYAALYRRLIGNPAVSIRTALYFPLLQQFREISTAFETDRTYV
ncbi:MAG: UvrD-helicase domain-containing protein [Woeseia sp.]